MGSMESMVAMPNLRGGIPISGIMAAGFPHGFSAEQAAGKGASADKNGLNMLPMMLQSIPHPHEAAIPQHTLFSVGAMMAHVPPQCSILPNPSSSSLLSVAKVTTTTTPSTSETASPSSIMAADKDSVVFSGSFGGEEERNWDETRAAEASKRSVGADAAAIVTSTSRAHFSTTHFGAGVGRHIAFNPFLIPGMSHGLLYPHMFLPHGGIMALPAMPPGAGDGPPSSPKRRRKRAQNEREEEKAVVGKAEERKSSVKASVTSHSASSSSSPSTPSTSAPGPDLCLSEEPQHEGDVEDRPADLQEPDSNLHLKEATKKESEERLDDTGQEAVEEGKQDTEEQKYVQQKEA